MADFASYGDELSKRYDQAVSAANQQRRRDREPGETYGTEVQNNLNSEVDSPEALTGMSSSATREQFDPGVDDRAGAMKNYLIQKSKDRMNRAVAPED